MKRQPPIPLEEAQARLLTLAPALPLERVDVDSALDRYLAEPLYARRTQPEADLSAMDGYAVCKDDMKGPWRVVGESAAGHPYEEAIASGQAVRISTGAILPAETGGVILQEDIERKGDALNLAGEAPSPADKHIRRRGLDFVQNTEVLAAGTRIGPAQLALAIAAGHRHIPVRRRPRVAVIDSGDELAADPECCGPHQIPASNGAMIAGLIRTSPSEVERSGPVPDDMDALTGALERYADFDVLVTSGGASVGDHDLIRPALEAMGATIDFWRVAIKPGKPILVATRASGSHRQIVVGLPGNPVSSYVTAFHFVLPLLRAMAGAAHPLPRQIRATLAAPLKQQGERREFLRGTWDGTRVTPHAIQDSGALASLAASNVLIDRPANSPQALPGDEVGIYWLQNGGIA